MLAFCMVFIRSLHAHEFSPGTEAEPKVQKPDYYVIWSLEIALWMGPPLLL